MGDVEEASWLSGIIDRLDKLALKIGGYGEQAQEFSDDESDSSTSEEDEDFGSDADDDEDDSGFEDAGSSSGGPPPTSRPENENGVQLPGGGDDVHGDREEAHGDMRKEWLFELSTERFPPVARPANNSPSNLITPSHSQDDLDKDEVPALGVTPLIQQDATSGSFSATFSTPAHSRNAFDPSPPPNAIPARSGAGSRRVHRGRFHGKAGPGATSSEEDTPVLAEPLVGAAVEKSDMKERLHRSPSEMDQQLGQDLLAQGYSEAEIDSQEWLTEASLDECAVDAAMSEEEGEASEVVASSCPKDEVDANGHDPPPEQENLVGHGQPPKQDEVNLMVKPDREEDDRERERREGASLRQGAGKEGVESPDMWTGEVATIGAKRASIDNGLGAQEADWALDSPQGSVPSKRGKVESEYPLAVMRHSARLDDAIHERNRKLGAQAADSRSNDQVAELGNGESENGSGDELAMIPWPDRALRPYDSPIVDTELPARQARELRRLGIGPETLIVSSPFRRCLQTAGVVARTLGIASVTVNLQVGERMDKVRKEIVELVIAKGQNSDGAISNGLAAPEFSYLDEEAMRVALGTGVKLERIVGEQPPQDESGVEAKQRFIDTISKVREEQLRKSPVLVVAHGDTLDAAGESLASQIVFEADYCAWALFELDKDSGYVTESYGIQMIPL